MTREEAIGKWIYPAIATMWKANKCNEILEALEPKTGHWIDHEYNGTIQIECSKCSSWFLRAHLIRNTYCPNCGSKMEGSDFIWLRKDFTHH